MKKHMMSSLLGAFEGFLDFLKGFLIGSGFFVALLVFTSILSN